ncbi:MAG TPA: MerR family transcriptional regulator [Thermoanaerobaculia bacterium]|nr:MerR family transcriptional regulator [Thermoanaerobaculia bacterium]
MSEAAEDKKLYKIGEVCKMADVQPYVLRYWETEFPSLAPNKSGGGQRLYTRREIDIILRIKQLLYSEGFTIAGAKKKLETEGGSPTPVSTPAHRPVKPKSERNEVLSRVKNQLQDILKILGTVLTLFLLACNNGPTEPRAFVIADGRWSGDGACLLVRSSQNTFPHSITLIAGCGHGEMPLPTVRNDGTFDVDGTYRIEAGPVSINPAPPAHYSGTLTNTELILKVQPSDPAMPAATYRFHMDPNGTCAPACV